MCWSGFNTQGTAVAMQDTYLKAIPSTEFLTLLASKGLMEGFVKYLAGKLAIQQEIITEMVAINSKLRLGKTLLRLARKLGNRSGIQITIKHKITHEELSEMVGTMRPRITGFLKEFKKRGLIEKSRDGFLIINETKLIEYLDLNTK